MDGHQGQIRKTKIKRDTYQQTDKSWRLWKQEVKVKSSPLFIGQVNTDNEIKDDGDVYGPHHW